MEHMVYVLESEVDKGLYIGTTKDIHSRLRRHNYGLVRSTKSHRPFRVIGTKSFQTSEEARRMELELKSYKDPRRVRAWIA